MGIQVLIIILSFLFLILSILGSFKIISSLEKRNMKLVDKLIDFEQEFKNLDKMNKKLFEENQLLKKQLRQRSVIIKKGSEKNKKYFQNKNNDD